MKSTQVLLPLCILLSTGFAEFRPDLGTNVEIAQLDKDQTVPPGATEIPISIAAGSDYDVNFRCTIGSGKQFVFSEDGHFVGCCLPGQHLSGSKDSAFSCCGAGHEQAGDRKTGWACCLKGFSWDGAKCNPPPKAEEPPPPPGKPVTGGTPDTDVGNGECAHGCTCKGCSSGIVTGKCYTIIFPSGERWGYEAEHGYYGPGPESRNQKAGKFQFCATESCTPGQPLDPADGFRIRDIYGVPNTGNYPNSWLNNLANGGHITKTQNYADAGVFTISKWPCGKYCLSGLDAGLGPTCPATVVGATFTPNDPQSCLEVELVEVPCDIKSKQNNCIWTNGKDQCCGKMDCSCSK